MLKKIRGVFVSFIVLAVFSAIPTVSHSSTGSSKRIGIFVGINKGSSSERPLKYAATDASKLRTIFVKYGQVEPQDAYLITEPSKETLIRTFSHIKKKIKSESTQTSVFFFFTGHGDSKALHIGNQIYPREELHSALVGMKSDFLLSVIDACQTETVYRRKGIRINPKFDISKAHVNSPKGVVIIQSTQKGDPAYESDNLKSAVFTNHFLTALRGAADSNNDKHVSLLEAYSYSYRETVHSSARNSDIIQYPNFDMAFQGTGEVMLTDLSTANASLSTTSDVDSKYFLFTLPKGELVAELYVPKNKTASIAVSSGKFLIQKRTIHGAYATEVVLPFGGHKMILPTDFVPVKLNDYNHKGTTGIYRRKLHAAYGLKFENFYDYWRLINSIQLGFVKYFSTLTFSVYADVMFSSYTNSNFTSKEITPGIYSTLGYSFALHRSTIDINMGPALQLQIQKRSHRIDDDRLELAGLENTEPEYNYSLAPGAVACTRWFVPIYKRLELYMLGEFTATFYNTTDGDDYSITPRWQLNMGIGMGYVF